MKSLRPTSPLGNPLVIPIISFYDAEGREGGGKPAGRRCAEEDDGWPADALLFHLEDGPPPLCLESRWGGPSMRRGRLEMTNLPLEMEPSSTSPRVPPLSSPSSESWPDNNERAGSVENLLTRRMWAPYFYPLTYRWGP
uniref:Uncharacterized protein n=1 Tax=Oryza meridionalis TaxID=40149 RepID=A0A0E0C010_9ORYZ